MKIAEPNLNPSALVPGRPVPYKGVGDVEGWGCGWRGGSAGRRECALRVLIGYACEGLALLSFFDPVHGLSTSEGRVGMWGICV